LQAPPLAAGRLPLNRACRARRLAKERQGRAMERPGTLVRAGTNA